MKMREGLNVMVMCIYKEKKGQNSNFSIQLETIDKHKSEFSFVINFLCKKKTIFILKGIDDAILFSCEIRDIMYPLGLTPA